MSKIPKPPSIGKNVKHERSVQKLSLDELSTASGVSKAMLSQIESGKVNPTVATMWKIAHGLSVEFNVLMKGEGKKIRRFDINRKADITTLDADAAGVHISVLSPVSMAEDLELYLLTFKPGATLNSQPHYPGTEEFLTVLAGKVKVSAGENETILNAGDVLVYQCDIEHHIENLAATESRIYLVVRF
ncbi:MAG: XRE family transcriptional regulator [Victivallaceae bacterium]|nr:XRE family transcriptional regulator [Victivallaceae bacterium]